MQACGGPGGIVLITWFVNRWKKISTISTNEHMLENITFEDSNWLANRSWPSNKVLLTVHQIKQ